MSILTIVCFLLPFICFAESVPIMTSINGFRGIKWGTLKSDIKETSWTSSSYLDTTSAGPEHPIWYYIRDGDKQKVGLAEVEIKYGFWRKSDEELIFCRVRIVCDVKENWDNLHRALIETFGPNYRNMEYTRIVGEWHSSMWQDPWGEVWLISKEVEKQIVDFVKEKAKKGLKDF